MIKINEKSMPEHYPREFWQVWLTKPPHLSFVAVDKKSNKVLGYLLGIKQQFNYLNANFEAALLASIAVETRYRKLGIATNLIHAFLSAAKNAHLKLAYLHVRVSNENAQRVYRKASWQLEILIPAYYPDGESAYLFTRAL
jgi:ribosomal-protein-alanine N-acetyltransferase